MCALFRPEILQAGAMKGLIGKFAPCTLALAHTHTTRTHARTHAHACTHAHARYRGYRNWDCIYWVVKVLLRNNKRGIYVASRTYTAGTSLPFHCLCRWGSLGEENACYNEHQEEMHRSASTHGSIKLITTAILSVHRSVSVCLPACLPLSLHLPPPPPPPTPQPTRSLCLCE